MTRATFSNKNICIAFFTLLALLYCMLAIKVTYAKSCIAAGDFGLGGSLYIPANPDENMTSGTRLIRSEPKTQQIAPWVDSYLFTLGHPPSDSQDTFNSLKVVITGDWNPWGHVEGVQYDACPLIPCDPANPHDAVCFNGGDVVVPDITKYPCELQDGWGLYGLISLAGSGSSGYANPNESVEIASTLPSQLFRTFRLSPATKGGQINQSKPDEAPKYEYHFKLDATSVCDENRCVKDVHPDGSEYIMRGRLFFKILDGYYGDNTGGLDVKVISGVYTERGFIETTVQMFQKQIEMVTKSLYQNLVANTHLIGIIRAMLILYVVLTGIMFTMGLVQASNRELFLRLFKFAIVATLVSDQSWDFFNTYLFTICRDGAADIATLIIRATLFYDGNYDSPVYYMPDKASPLSVYDVILKMLTKLPIHAKIWSMLFYEWKLYWIPCVYVGLYFIIKSILKSLMLYLLMLIQVALLLIVAPIFIMMLLFKVTKELFDTWLKQLVSSGILYIMLATSIAMMVKMIFGQIQSLLYFKICWDTIKDLWIFDLVFWYPQSSSEFDNAMNTMNFFAFILMSMVFFSIVEKIPEMVDILMGQGRMPTADLQHSAMSAYNNSFVAMGINKVQDQAAKAALSGVTAIDGGATANTMKRLGQASQFIQHSMHEADRMLGEDRDGLAKAFDAPDSWIGTPGAPSTKQPKQTVTTISPKDKIFNPGSQ